MMRLYPNELMCDLAETYQLFDYRRLPARTVAVLATGLRADSRTIMKMNGASVPSELLLMAAAIDRLSLLVWAQTEDAKKGLNKPTMISEKLLGKNGDEYQTVQTTDSFENEWKRRTEVNNGFKRN